jgi:hypothetical protein
MDILTHATTRLITASPFLADRPELAVGLVAGSVLLGLDALCPLMDKDAFLRALQTWSPAFPMQLAFSSSVGAASVLFGWKGVELGAGRLTGLIGLDCVGTQSSTVPRHLRRSPEFPPC